MGKQTENVKNVHAFLTTLSKIFDSNTFDIHRDTIASLISITNGTATLCMDSLKWKHKVINFRMTNEREYTVTMIEPSQDICDDVMKYSQEDIKKMDETSLDNYKKLLEGQKMREEETQHEGLQRFLEEKRKEQIDNGNKAENALKAVFDELGINYDYQHIEIIEDDEGKEHGYIYDFLVEIDNNKYDVEVDGSSHDGKEEQDKERDELSKKIGIYPIRFSTQMVYAIYNEVSKGIFKKSSLTDMIQGRFCSIDDMMHTARCLCDNLNDLIDRNKPLLEPMKGSLMNDEDNKCVNNIKDALNEKISGEYGEVVYGGKVIPTVTTKTPFTTVTCGTNGCKGGDWGHGSRTYVKVEGGVLSDYQIRKIDEDKEHGSSSGFEIAVGGDCELDSLIETFESIASNLKKMKEEIFKEKVYGILEKLNDSERKEVFEILKKEFDSKKEIRDEIVRECFLLSKKDSRQVEANDGEDEQLPF